MKNRSTIRSVFAVIFIGLGAVCALAMIRDLVNVPRTNVIELTLIGSCWALPIAVFLLSGILLGRRQYRYFAAIWVGIASFAVLVLTMLGTSGVAGWFARVMQLPGVEVLGIYLGLLAGFPVAHRFNDKAFGILSRYLPPDPK